MKQWMKKIIDQLQIEQTDENTKAVHADLNEEQATLVYILDVYSKHLFEIEKQSLKSVRAQMESLIQQMMHPTDSREQTLFKLRQFISSYRVDEYTYLLKTFEDFKNIVWSFADHLSEEIREDKKNEQTLKISLDQLREAVESNSIENLKKKSQQFIQNYVDVQSQKTAQKTKRMTQFRKNLKLVQKQLTEAHHSMRVDHLTQVYNRKSFDEQIKKLHQLFEVSKEPANLIILDIDFFKKINDQYGHDVGDYVLQECVKLLRDIFSEEDQFISRIGGEEFAILIPRLNLEQTQSLAEKSLEHIRKQIFVHKGHEIKFTVSMGIAEVSEGEAIDQWMKRADTALYESKNTGRNKATVSQGPKPKLSVA